MVKYIPVFGAAALAGLFFALAFQVARGHHTGVRCGAASGQADGRSVCLPLMDRSAAVAALRDDLRITYCFDTRARNYPNFVSQARQVADDFEANFGFEMQEITGTYQTSTAARNVGCQIWNSMPDVHGCSACGAWVHYLNWPVVVEYRWQAGYVFWNSTIVHEWLHIMGLHEAYDDANFRSHRGTYGYWAHGMERSPGTASDAPTVMDFGTGVSRLTAWDVAHGCQSIDRQGRIFPGCIVVDCSPVSVGGGWSFTTPECEPPDGNWYFNDLWVFGACDDSWDGRYIALADEWEDIGESEWFNRLGFHITVPPC